MSSVSAGVSVAVADRALMNPSMAARRLAAGLLVLTVLAACGGVKITPDVKLPRALVSPLPARVGVVVAGDMRNYTHRETRWGSNWQADLGPGHVHWAQELFGAAFREADLFSSLEEARASPGLQAIFEPRIVQYSFTTARETGRYFAATIRYRIVLYTPDGASVDALTITGYGNSLSSGASGARPLEEATRAAMRDAAAKFLVQFPEQEVARQIARGEPVLVAPAADAAGSADTIEAVPIEPESRASPVSPAPSGAATPQRGGILPFTRAGDRSSS